MPSENNNPQKVTIGKTKFANPDQMTANYINVTIPVFFDGTANNMYNTDAKAAYMSGKKTDDTVAYGKIRAAEEKGSSDREDGQKHTSSYENDYSNVARLYKMYNNETYKYAVYVQGEGTTKKEKDDSSGLGMGSGKTGIPAKVANGCSQVADAMKNILNAAVANNPNTKIKTITIDVFGFSRGSAAARHFVYEICRPAYKPEVRPTAGGHGKPRYIDEMGNDTEFQEFPNRGYLGAYCNKNKININEIFVKIRFAGLFDTVASYADGLFLPPNADNTPKSFQNDTKQLHLNSISVAEKIVHLTAMDEHRANFPLTNINSAGGKGMSFALPGVHSDIGGCYINNINENTLRINESADVPFRSEKKMEERLLNDKRTLIKQGWFEEEQFTAIQYSKVSGDMASRYYIGTTRSGISNNYSFIPLNIMFRIAHAYDSKNPMPFSWDDKSYSVNDNSLLSRIRDRLSEQVFQGMPPLTLKYYKDILYKYKTTFADKNMPKECRKELQEQNDLRELRSKYIHWNSDYQRTWIAAVGHVGANIIPMYPRMIDYENSVRERLVLNG